MDVLPLLLSSVIIDDDLIQQSPKFKSLYKAFFLTCESVIICSFKGINEAEYIIDENFHSYKLEKTFFFVQAKKGVMPPFGYTYPNIDKQLREIPIDSVILSNKKGLKRIIVDYNKSGPQTIILMLAALGISIPLPPAFFDEIPKEVLGEIKTSLNKERQEYLISILKLASDARDRLHSKASLDDLYHWAKNEVYFRILPVAFEYARQFEGALGEVDRKKCGWRKVSEYLPTISAMGVEGKKIVSPTLSALIRLDFIGAGSSIVGAVAQSIPVTKAPKSVDPLVNYTLKIRSLRQMIPRNSE